MAKLVVRKEYLSNGAFYCIYIGDRFISCAKKEEDLEDKIQQAIYNYNNQIKPAEIIKEIEI